MFAKILLYILVISAIFGCDAKKESVVTLSADLSIDDDLLERYGEYWTYMSKNDYDRSYEYELPYLNFLKSKEWYKEFQYGGKIDFKVKILSISEDKDDKDVVFVRANYRGKYLDSNITEKWINIKGTWYHYYSQSLLPSLPKTPNI
jgi:sarcosine oxidase delta subunit